MPSQTSARRSSYFVHGIQGLCLLSLIHLVWQDRPSCYTHPLVNKIRNRNRLLKQHGHGWPLVSGLEPRFWARSPIKASRYKNLLTTLVRTERKRCSDPHDKNFGICNLMSEELRNHVSVEDRETELKLGPYISLLDCVQVNPGLYRLRSGYARLKVRAGNLSVLSMVV